MIFPNEIAEVGFGVADQTMLPTFKKNSSQPEVEGTALPPDKPDEYDYFRSTTARFTKGVPFQVLSDGRYVYVFRQAIGSTDLESMVHGYISKDGQSHLLVSNKEGVKGYVEFNKDKKKNEWVPVSADETTVPLVNASLLVDRFVMVGNQLTPKMEVRYQRSRSKTRPASRKDSLGPKDLEGNIFYEPTQELKFIANLKDGHFSVLMLPTAIAEIKRWQIFAENGITGRLDSYNVECSSDGLFNTRGTQTYTCEKHLDVYTRQSGTCPQCGKPLIPRLVNNGYSESALEFRNSNDNICIKNRPELNFSKAITIETWIKFSKGMGSCVIWRGDANKGLGYLLAINQDSKPGFAISINGVWVEVVWERAMNRDTWYHLAGSFDGSNVRFFINGEETKIADKQGEISSSEMDLNIKCTTSTQDTTLPLAVIDEIRLWKRARSSAELKEDMHHRLTGLESDLVGYWRFDEDSGSDIHDQTNNRIDGTIYGAEWIGSDAPVGEHSGIERTSFEIKGRSFKSGPACLLYYQQSKTVSGYSGEEKPLKNTGRVMLAVATNDKSNPDKNNIAALDFSVSSSGRLTQIPDNLELRLLNPEEIVTNESINEMLKKIDDLESQIPAKQQAVEGAKKELGEAKDWKQIKAAKVLFYNKNSPDQILAFSFGNFSDISQKFIFQLDKHSSIEDYTYNAPQEILVTPDLPKNRWIIEVQPWKIADVNKKISDAKLKLQKAQKALADLLAVIQPLKSLRMSGASVIMPHIHTDALGLTISGGLLGFAWTNDAPFLFDSATGSLALYFRGQDDQFFVTYYDTLTERAKATLLSNGKDAVSCFSTSTAYDKISIEVGDDKNKNSAACTVSIFYGASRDDFVIKENWNNVPRAAQDFSRILNGQATEHTYVGSGQKTKDNELTLLDPGAKRSINAGAILMVGEECITVSKQIFVGDKLIPFEGSLRANESQSLPIFCVEYDYNNATCEGISADLSKGSILIRAITVGDSKMMVSNTDLQEPNELVPSLVCKWTAAAPGIIVSLNDGNTFAEADANKINDFDAAGDLALEAWVRPMRIEGKAQIIKHCSSNSNYLLALEECGQDGTETFDGKTWIEIHCMEPLSGTFTVEAWVRPDDTKAIIGIMGSRRPKDYGFDLKFMEGNKIHGDIGNGTNWITTTADVDFTYVVGTWYHVAYVVTPSGYNIYVNGIIQGDPKKFQSGGCMPLLLDDTHTLIIGETGQGNEYMKGAIDEVRIWKRARSQGEIQADMYRHLNGAETGLIGYWYLVGKAPNISDFTLWGKLSERDESPLQAYKVIAGVGGKLVKTCENIYTRNWTHLAAAFHQAYGLEFDGDDTLNCGNDTTLDINQDLTIETFLQITYLNRQRVIIRRGEFGDGEQHVPYSLSLNTANLLEFAFEDVNQVVHKFPSNALTAGFHKVAVTRKRLSKQDNKSIDPNKPDLYLTAWDEINFYVDGVEYGSAKYESVQPDSDKSRQPVDVGNSNKPVIIGNSFKGVIAEVRVWNTARDHFPTTDGKFFVVDKKDIGASINGNEQGLVSWWRFQEGKGNKAFDSKSQNHATITGAQWVKSPDPQGSSLKLYINGQLENTEAPEDPTVWATSVPQFMLGARKTPTTTDQYFEGELEEVRIWQTARTEEQIRDNLFRRIQGEKEDLIAYYTFDAESNDNISDYSLRSNHLALKVGSHCPAKRVLSTAPIGEDTPQVRSALMDIRTPFSGIIGSTPGSQEYAAMEYDSQGNLISVLKRCYSFILDGNWQIITGYKVGDMVTEWVGQVQFAPQLIGFVEGAPPVPSENLTLSNYNQASSIELTEAEQTTYTYASSRNKGIDMSLNFNLGIGAKFKTSVGFMTYLSIMEFDSAIGVKTSVERSEGWLEDASTSASRTTGKTTRLELRGRVATLEEAKDDLMGRRFMPDNVGLALVKSETADVHALRLRHNDALIAYQMMPNPDIPKDWNIIHFPINPRYTKQGTLDGKIGLKPDVDYPNGLTYSSDSSYFKPIEAYARKNRIIDAEMQLKTYFEQYAAGAIGRAGESSALKTGRVLDNLPQLHKRNLVNTYVWTADGGLFAETQETMDSQQEMIGGSYAIKGLGGIYAYIKTSAFGLAVDFALNALFGGHLSLTVNKTQKSSSSFAMNIRLDKVERDIYERDEHGEIVVDASDPKRPMPIKQPGKVDAYRFMSFYLEPQSDHFDDFFNLVVDPIWLVQSNDPSAVALRGARDDGKKPACWRILHRVTYVSRVLPPLDPSAPPSIERTLQTLDIDSNYELIKQLEPYVRDHLDNFGDFCDAVDDTIEKYLPELKPHEKEVKAYLSLYYGIDEGLNAPDTGY